MTAELIEKLRFSLNFLGISGGEYMTIAMNRAEIETLIAILEEYKQLKELYTPKKPKDNHHCPNCEWSQPIPLLDDEWCSECFYPEYCKHCGQRLDWSEEKENYEKRRNKK